VTRANWLVVAMLTKCVDSECKGSG